MTTNPNFYAGKFDPFLSHSQIVSADDVALKLWRIKQSFKDIALIKGWEQVTNLTAGTLCTNTTPQTGGNIADREIRLSTFSVNYTICKSDLVDDFYSEMMQAGAANDNIPPIVMETIMKQMTADVARHLAELRWVGDTASSTPSLALMDGILTKTRAALPYNAVTNPTGYRAVAAATTIDATNVIGEINKVIDALPITMITKPNLKLLVSPEIGRAYRQAVANSVAFGTWNFANASMGGVNGASLGFFANSNVEIIVINQFAVVEPKTMLLGRFDDTNDGNLLLFTDALADFSNLIIQDRGAILAREPFVDFVWTVRQGVDVRYYNEVVLYA